MRFYLLTIMAAAILLSGCSEDRRQSVVPRPTAYPRPTLYEPIYLASDSLPVTFEINSSALLSVRQPGKNGTVWADINYPAYGATIHLTFTPVDSSSLEDVMSNRAQRMALNLGTNEGVQTDVLSDNGNFESIVLTSVGQTLTPVQILSVSDRWVVSGALHFTSENVNADSLMPMLKAVERDMIHAARKLN